MIDIAAMSESARHRIALQIEIRADVAINHIRQRSRQSRQKHAQGLRRMREAFNAAIAAQPGEVK
jgi:hypothetical protein